MSYYASVDDVLFEIKKEHIPDALKAIKNTFNDDKETDLKELFLYHSGWELTFNEDGNVDCIMNIAGDGRITSADEEILKVVAPYVEPGSFILMHRDGDGGSVWKWYFNGSECVQKYATYDFDKSGEIVEAILKRDDVLTFMNIHPELDKRIAEKMKEDNNG